MRLNIKRNLAAVMSALMIMQCGGYGCAEVPRIGGPDTGLSFVQKIKLGFGAFKDKICRNPKTSATVGGGIGLAAIVGLILAIAIPRMRKGKKANNESKKKEFGNAQKSNEKPIKAPSPVVTPEPIPEEKPNPSPNSGAAEEDRPTELADTGAKSEEKDEETGSESSSETQTIIEDDLDDAVTEDDTLAGGDLSELFGDDGNEKIKEEEPEAVEPIQEQGSTPPESASDAPATIRLPRAPQEVAVPPRESRSPSPMPKYNDTLTVELSTDVVSEIEKFCKERKLAATIKVNDKPVKTQLIIENWVKFLAKIENISCNPNDLTSYLENAAKRCLNNFNQVASGARKFSWGFGFEFRNFVNDNPFPSANAGGLEKNPDWDSFTGSLLRNFVLLADVNDPKSRMVRLKTEKPLENEITYGFKKVVSVK